VDPFSIRHLRLSILSDFGVRFFHPTPQINRWKRRKTFSSNDIARMNEVEFTSECLSLMINNKLSGKSSSQLENLFSKYDETYPQREEVEKRFRWIMDSIDNHFNSPSDFAFNKKTLAYVFFAFMYEQIYGITSDLSQPKTPKTLSVTQVSAMKLISERIKSRTAPEDVLDATDRRTTNPKERTTLFNYILKSVK
jgi:hypothetical protein